MVLSLMDNHNCENACWLVLGEQGNTKYEDSYNIEMYSHVIVDAHDLVLNKAHVQ